jgi:putative dehydrogenase
VTAAQPYSGTGVDLAVAKQTVGFIGLGTMGGAMAAHLLSVGDFRLVGHDLDLDCLASFEAAGGTPVDSAAKVAVESSIIVLSLPSVAAFCDVVDELVAHARPGTVVIETSTLPLAIKADGLVKLAAQQVILLDAPLSGTGQQARDGDLVAYLSGDDAALDRVTPVIAGFTRNHHRLGEFGNGTKMKLIANLLVAVHNVAAAEALLLAKRVGLDLPSVLTAVGDGAGTSRMFEIRGPLMVADSFDDATITVDVFAKDIAIIASLAEEADSPTPLFTAASAVYGDALTQGRGAQDTASVFAVLSSQTAAPTTSRNLNDLPGSYDSHDSHDLEPS